MVTYNAARKETHRAEVAEWRAAHPEVDAAHSAKRRAIKRNATISPIPHGTWAQLHSDCKAFELLTGELWAIDHIVPLARGGSHSEDNLRPLPARLNSVKGAKLDHEVTSEAFQSHLAATGSSFEQVTWRSFHFGSGTTLET
jgi:5-methylcytosine-specific restriction endonuclease McrA